MMDKLAMRNTDLLWIENIKSDLFKKKYMIKLMGSLISPTLVRYIRLLLWLTIQMKEAWQLCTSVLIRMPGLCFCQSLTSITVSQWRGVALWLSISEKEVWPYTVVINHRKEGLAFWLSNSVKKVASVSQSKEKCRSCDLCIFWRRWGFCSTYFQLNEAWTLHLPFLMTVA